MVHPYSILTHMLEGEGRQVSTRGGRRCGDRPAARRKVRPCACTSRGESRRILIGVQLLGRHEQARAQTTQYFPLVAPPTCTEQHSSRTAEATAYCRSRVAMALNLAKERAVAVMVVAVGRGGWAGAFDMVAHVRDVARRGDLQACDSAAQYLPVHRRQRTWLGADRSYLRRLLCTPPSVTWSTLLPRFHRWGPLSTP